MELHDSPDDSAASDEIGAAVLSNTRRQEPSEMGASTMKLITMTQVTVVASTVAAYCGCSALGNDLHQNTIRSSR
jgi:hypothetical protein